MNSSVVKSGTQGSGPQRSRGAFSGVVETVTSIRIPDAPPTLTGTGLEVSRLGCLWNHDTHSVTLSGAGSFLGSPRLLGSKTLTGLVKRSSPKSPVDLILSKSGVSGGSGSQPLPISHWKVGLNSGTNRPVGRLAPSTALACFFSFSWVIPLAYFKLADRKS